MIKILSIRVGEQTIDLSETTRIDLDESTSHRSDDWLRALGAQDELKEEAIASENSENHA
jgi:hypothetical protein